MLIWSGLAAPAATFGTLRRWWSAHANAIARPRTLRHPSMTSTRLTATGLAALVAIPFYDYVSVTFNSSILGLMAVSFLLIALLGLMRCMLDPCAQ